MHTGHISAERYINELGTPLAFEKVALDDQEDFMNKARNELGLPSNDDEELDLLDKLEKAEEEWKPTQKGEWPKEEWDSSAR